MGPAEHEYFTMPPPSNYRSSAVPISRTKGSKDRSASLKMSKHSIFTTRNLDFYLNSNKLIDVRIFKCLDIL